MGAYVLRRILISFPVLLGITILGFVALRSAPGDPLLASINPEVLGNLAAHPVPGLLTSLGYQIHWIERSEMTSHILATPASAKPADSGNGVR